jgi:hypothetical protein
MKNLLPVVIALLIGLGAGILYCKLKQNDDKSFFFGSSIKYAEGVSLADSFKNVRAPLIQDGLRRRFPATVAANYQETRSIWYSYNEIQGFLNKMNKEYPNSKDKLGIRIYFGAYAKRGTFSASASNEHKMTAFFVATLNQARNSNPAITVDSDMVDKTKGDKSTWTFLGIDPYDHGTLCPPQNNCGGTIF